MIQYKVVYAQEAYQDLVKIYNYVLAICLEPSIAGNLVNKIKKAIATLNYFPFRHPKYESFTKPSENVRRLIAGGYAIIYRVDDENKTVTILEVASCKRDYKNAKSAN